ncbi:hypothetical protein BD770DRAFT_380133, partial [Pilaira anomala]
VLGGPWTPALCKNPLRFWVGLLLYFVTSFGFSLSLTPAVCKNSLRFWVGLLLYFVTKLWLFSLSAVYKNSLDLLLYYSLIKPLF